MENAIFIIENGIKHNFYDEKTKNVNVKKCLGYVKTLCDLKLYHTADHLINELYELYTGTIYENVNPIKMNDDDENEMFLLIKKISNKLYGGKTNDYYIEQNQ